MQKMMILGAQGMLGTEMTYYFQNKYEIIPLASFNLDIANKKLVQSALEQYKPNLVVNCAAYTNVERAEAKYERDIAMQVNGDAVAYLAEFCSQMGITLVQISTDYVFDGKKKSPYLENDSPNPLNMYGKSKFFAEQHILNFAKLNSNWEYYIIRTAWLYGSYGPNFVKKMLHLAKSGNPLKVVNDQTGSPTFTLALVRGIEQIIEQKIYTKGIYHLVGDGETSWADFALEIFRLKGWNVALEKVDSAYFTQTAKRPSYSVLKNTKGPVLPVWQEQLAEYLQIKK